MKYTFSAFFLLVFVFCFAQDPPPSRNEILKEMAIPSTETIRGQKDGIGYAKTKDQMDEIWRLSEAPPSPDCFGEQPISGAIAVIAPHDDYIYAGRVYRSVIPSLKAKTVIIIGPLHRSRDFNIKNKIVFDSYKAWRTPDGEAPVSKIRDTIINGMPENEFIVDNTMHDAEHSIEGPLYFLRHCNPDVEIIPILVTPMDYEMMKQILYDVGMVLGNYLEFNGIKIGSDVAFLISSDAVHYGPDFKYTPHGADAVAAYSKAVDTDKEIISKLLSRTVNDRRTRAIFERFQDLNAPEVSNITWCGRFAIPFGLNLASRLFNSLKGKGNKGLVMYGSPIAYSTSIGAPDLPSKTGLGVTAPSNLYHFVGYPGVIYNEAMVEPLSQMREPLK